MSKRTTTIVAIIGFLSFALFFVFLGLSQEYKGWVVPTIGAFAAWVGIIFLLGQYGETKK